MWRHKINNHLIMIQLNLTPNPGLAFLFVFFQSDKTWTQPTWFSSFYFYIIYISFGVYWIVCVMVFSFFSFGSSFLLLWQTCIIQFYSSSLGLAAFVVWDLFSVTPSLFLTHLSELPCEGFPTFSILMFFIFVLMISKSGVCIFSS